jgi:hypothetical protein
LWIIARCIQDLRRWSEWLQRPALRQADFKYRLMLIVIVTMVLLKNQARELQQRTQKNFFIGFRNMVSLFAVHINMRYGMSLHIFATYTLEQRSSGKLL